MAFVNVPRMRGWDNLLHSKASMDRLRAIGRSEGASSFFVDLFERKPVIFRGHHESWRVRNDNQLQAYCIVHAVGGEIDEQDHSLDGWSHPFWSCSRYIPCATAG